MKTVVAQFGCAPIVRGAALPTNVRFLGGEGRGRSKTSPQSVHLLKNAATASVEALTASGLK